jgi:PAS domain S-box-containing protein
MACAVSGYSREELLAMDLATLLPAPNREAAEALAQAMDGGLDRWTSVERCMMRKDGRPVHVAWSGVVITYEGAPAVLGTGINVTDDLALEVRDDGYGFDPKAARVAAVGLVSMEERALALGGLLEVDSTPGAGASIRLHCPLRERTPSTAA